jgi:hypothetical protein
MFFRVNAAFCTVCDFNLKSVALGPRNRFTADKN